MFIESFPRRVLGSRAHRTLAVGLGLILGCMQFVACAGRTQEDTSVRPSHSSASEVKDPRQTSESNASNDLQQVCQLVLDIGALQDFFHADQLPERKPLKVLENEHLAAQPELTKFGVPVRFISRQEATTEPFFEFTKITIGEDRAEVAFRYRVEGVRGSATLTRDGSAWKVTDQSIAEQ